MVTDFSKCIIGCYMIYTPLRNGHIPTAPYDKLIVQTAWICYFILHIGIIITLGQKTTRQVSVTDAVGLQYMKRWIFVVSFAKREWQLPHWCTRKCSNLLIIALWHG